MGLGCGEGFLFGNERTQSTTFCCVRMEQDAPLASLGSNCASAGEQRQEGAPQATGLCAALSAHPKKRRRFRSDRASATPHPPASGAEPRVSQGTPSGDATAEGRRLPRAAAGFADNVTLSRGLFFPALPRPNSMLRAG